MSYISFFGYEVLPSKTGQHEPPDGCILHLSQAALAGEVEENEEVLLFVAVHPMIEEDMKDEPKKYCVCRLNRKKSSVCLNLNFGVSDMVFFSIERAPKEGDKEKEEEEEDPSCSVHLTGYYKVVEDDLIFDDDDEDEVEEMKKILEGEDVEGLLEGDMESESEIVPPPSAEDGEEKGGRGKRKRKKLDYKALNENFEKGDFLDDEEDDGDFAPGSFGQGDDDDDDEDEDDMGFPDYSHMNNKDLIDFVSGSTAVLEEEEEETEVKPSASTTVPPPPSDDVVQETHQMNPKPPALGKTPEEEDSNKKKKKKKKKRKRKFSGSNVVIGSEAPTPKFEGKITGKKRPRSNESTGGGGDGQPSKKKRKRKRKKKPKKKKLTPQQHNK